VAAGQSVRGDPFDQVQCEASGGDVMEAWLRREIEPKLARKGAVSGETPDAVASYFLNGHMLYDGFLERAFDAVRERLNASAPAAAVGFHKSWRSFKTIAVKSRFTHSKKYCTLIRKQNYSGKSTNSWID
jgi:hypothetical protein